MALNDHDRNWIRLTIGEALRAHSGTFLTRFKSWSPLGAVVALGIFILVQWNSYTVFRTHTEDHLTDNDKQLIDLTLKLSAKSPINFKVIPKVSDQAKAAGITPSIGAIQEAGQDLIKATEETNNAAEAWKDAILLVDYRTTVNRTLAPPAALTLQPDVTKRFSAGYSVRVISGPGGSGDSTFTVSGHLVPPDEAAIAEAFEQPEIQKGPLLPEYVGFGGEIAIDDSIWKNIVAHDALVEYSGRRVRLENVYFINCRFKIAPTANGRKFSNALLAGTAINLTLQD